LERQGIGVGQCEVDTSGIPQLSSCFLYPVVLRMVGTSGLYSASKVMLPAAEFCRQAGSSSCWNRKLFI